MIVITNFDVSEVHEHAFPKKIENLHTLLYVLKHIQTILIFENSAF